MDNIRFSREILEPPLPLVGTSKEDTEIEKKKHIRVILDYLSNF